MPTVAVDDLTAHVASPVTAFRDHQRHPPHVDVLTRAAENLRRVTSAQIEDDDAHNWLISASSTSWVHSPQARPIRSRCREGSSRRPSGRPSIISREKRFAGIFLQESGQGVICAQHGTIAISAAAVAAMSLPLSGLFGRPDSRPPVCVRGGQGQCGRSMLAISKGRWGAACVCIARTWEQTTSSFPSSFAIVVGQSQPGSAS